MLTLGREASTKSDAPKEKPEEAAEIINTSPPTLKKGESQLEPLFGHSSSTKAEDSQGSNLKTARTK